MLISPDEIDKSLSNRGWNYKNNQISKTFKFETYMDSIKFINNLSEVAEQKNHHPDMHIGWCVVKINISSHDMGGVTTKCVNLALSIDSIKL
ncbi:MAG: 4a-hydroxytetrahydrobiopterin dehydratase [bacterium TMED198]|nr:MAG: 4a-hydroxytetrahydrobiopterin dehydratase [bacterium TMED198]